MAPISGSYRGTLTAPVGGAQRLDLRIDVDSRISEGPVLGRVSGDVFRVEKVSVPGKPPKETEVYQESWILENPRVDITADATLISGVIRYWNGIHPKTNIQIRIPLQPPGAPAEVTLQRQSVPAVTYTCPPAGKFFRSLRLELDVCKSVDIEPTLPVYGTHSLKQRPPGVSERVLTVERTFGEAGVEVRIRTDKRTVIDDTAKQDGWTDAELHNALERHFTSYKGPWPKWEMWGLLAGLYHDDLIGGVMFDFAAAESGPTKAPERQGFAIFRKHEWFEHLVADPQTPEQLEAARQFLWTFTHEAGHAFNLVHSFEKNREDALSWMNYAHMYDATHGDGAYWKNFRFRFDDEELMHIRHGNRPSVMMGGDPFMSGGHAEAPPGAEHLRMPPGALTSISGEVPLEVLLRAQPYHEFLEPVSIEIRVRNLMPVPVSVSDALHPETGSVSLYVRRPDGRIVQYMPITCKIALDRHVTLAPAGAPDDTDRHNRTIFVSYGRYGFYFDEPGQYHVRAVYHGPGNLLIPSNVLRMRVGHPKDEASDRIAQDFFSYEAGAALYLGGSHSEYLRGGMNTLLTAVEQQRGTRATAKTAARIARGVGMPFHDLAFDAQGEEAVVHRATGGEVEHALALSDVALRTLSDQPSDRDSFLIERLGRTRSDMLMRLGNEEQARDELLSLAAGLIRRGVKRRVVARIEELAGNLAPKPRRPPRKRR